MNCYNHENDSNRYQYFFLYLTTENADHRDPGMFTWAVSEDGVDKSGFGLETIARFELPHPMADQAFKSWLAESDEAYEMLAECIGDEKAEQIREDTLDVWL